MLFNELTRSRIIIHDQDQRLIASQADRMSALGTRLSRRLARHRLLALRSPRQADGEGRAHARLTFDRDVATHHPAKMFADREAKTGTAVFAGGGDLGL